VDALGNPLRLVLTGGNTHDSVMAQAMIDDLEAEFTIADKAYDAEEIVAKILEQGSTPVIPPRSNRRRPREYDKHLYKERHLVECFFCKIKEFRRIATRFEKLEKTFLTMVTIASCLVWLR
jgi:transposase